MYDLAFFLILLAAGYAIGQYKEKKHYRSIYQRESDLKSLPIIASKHLPSSINIEKTQLVTGNVVISVDYFKRFIAGLRNLTGGRVTSYETLIDRARREAILRMKEQASNLNAESIYNIKMETASISKGRKNAVGTVEVLAYGTAVMTNKS